MYMLQVDPLAPHPSGRDLLEVYRALQFTERDVLQVCNLCRCKLVRLVSDVCTRVVSACLRC